MSEFHEGETARAEAADIIAAAEVRASALIEDAELRARERADEVIAQYQARLDALLEQERKVRERLAELGGEAPSGGAKPINNEESLVDDRDALYGIDVRPDASLAEFMKTMVRDDVSEPRQ